MKRLHVVGDRNPCNGMFVAASLMAAHEEGSRVVTCAEFLTTDLADYADYDEVVVHGCWLPCYWKSCLKVLRLRGVGNRCRCTKDGTNSTVHLHLQPSPSLSRMTHANLDPVRIKYHGWKKRLVAPIERWLLRRCDKILVTCEEEKKWVWEYLDSRSLKSKSKKGDNIRSSTSTSNFNSKIQIIDLKTFFNFKETDALHCTPTPKTYTSPLHVLYLGRRHPLKGVEYLERAVKEINESSTVHLSPTPTPKIELRLVSDHYGEELERDWDWCDVLCLPTLSENFGLVVAEALERGKGVITTDGAPAWGDLEEGAFIYLRGFREGTDRQRIELLKDALKEFVD